METSVLQRTLERFSTEQRVRLPPAEAPPVLVAALRRYRSASDGGAFDVTLADGRWRVRCRLGPELNRLVHRGVLRAGVDVRVTQCAYVYDEQTLGRGFVSVEGLVCCDGASRYRGPDPAGLPVLDRGGPGHCAPPPEDAPLLGDRKHYLPLWNNDDPEGDLWEAGLPSRDVVLDVSKISLLHTLVDPFSTRRLPLLVRVLHKSRLRFYGRSGMKIDWPYQAYLEVADQTGSMSLVLWNEVCPEFYRRVAVGTVLYLQNYTLKKSYPKRSRPQMDHYGMMTFPSVEICLNPRNPVSVITVVPPKNVRPEWGLPEVSYVFTTRSEVENLSLNSACDVIGLVTFVGRVERLRSKEGDPEKFWMYRWVHALDGTSDQPFILEIFSSSQPEVFNAICPMTYLVCTQMRTCGTGGSSCYLTTSCETQMFITGFHKGQPYTSDPVVKSFIQWTKTLRDDVILQKTAIGGYYRYPPSPQTFSPPGAGTPGQVPLVAASVLKNHLEALHFREHKRLAIQGQITAVRYRNLLRNTGSPSRQTQNVPGHSCEEAAAEPFGGTSLLSEQPSAGSGPDSRKKRRAGPQDEEGEEEEGPGEQGLQRQDPDVDGPSWESSRWTRQRQEVEDHLLGAGLFLDSLCRRFSLDDKDGLLQWSNLYPARWTPQQSAAPAPQATPGYLQITILGINKQIAIDAAFLPVTSSRESDAEGGPHDLQVNSLLSLLTTGLLSPLTDSTGPSASDFDAILASAGELEDLHLVCVLDLCHLGGEDVEVLVNKVYRVSD